LITARAAAEQGREVFAIPGSIHSPFSRGSHRLIKDGAKLVETAQDILEELGAFGPIAMPSAGAAADKAKDASDSGDATRILAALGSEGATVDRLVERSGLSSSAVTVALLELELRGQVAALPGGAFQRIH
jgi:DNA processing protein